VACKRSERASAFIKPLQPLQQVEEYFLVEVFTIVLCQAPASRRPRCSSRGFANQYLDSGFGEADRPRLTVFDCRSDHEAGSKAGRAVPSTCLRRSVQARYVIVEIWKLIERKPL
jgi:hypothetical protein